MNTKTCSKCGEAKPLDRFSRRAAMKDGLKSQCKDCDSLLRRAYYENNKDREREQNRQWHQKNKPWLDPQKRERFNAWRRSSNRRAEWANRDALKRGAEGTFTHEEWVSLCETYNNKCLCCGRGDAMLTVDHVKPLSKGGTNWIDNIQPLCTSCNCSKGAREIDYRKNLQ